MSLVANYAFMLFDPRKAFSEALSRKILTLIVPLALAILLTGAVNVYYFYAVDMGWLSGQMTATLTPEQREAALPLFTRGRLLAISLLGVVFLALGINLARAFFIWIILKVRGGESPRFVRLFAVVMWSTAPLLLILPAAMLNISLAPDGRIPGNDVNPVSLNQLVFRLPSETGWGAMLSTFSLINLWEMVLIAIGLQTVTDLPFSRAALLAIAPDLLVYGIWTAFLAVGSLS